MSKDCIQAEFDLGGAGARKLVRVFDGGAA